MTEAYKLKEFIKEQQELRKNKDEEVFMEKVKKEAYQQRKKYGHNNAKEGHDISYVAFHELDSIKPDD